MIDAQIKLKAKVHSKKTYPNSAIGESQNNFHKYRLKAKRPSE